MKKILFALTFLCFSLPLFAQKNPLVITESDFYVLPGDAATPGYHLYIRKNPGLESVMLVESNKDPKGKQTNYAYRAKNYNSINGDEIRYLNGKVLESKYAKYSLIDSSAENDKYFGQAFHLYIPETLVFGYPWARNGEIKVGDELFVNIRTFSKKYGDYTGSFKDNSFTIKFKEKSPENLNANADDSATALLPNLPTEKENPEEEKNDKSKPENPATNKDFYQEPSENPSENLDENNYPPIYLDSNLDAESPDPESSDSENSEILTATSTVATESPEVDKVSLTPFEEEEVIFTQEELDAMKTASLAASASKLLPEDRDTVAEPFEETEASYDPSQLDYKNSYSELPENINSSFYSESMEGVDIKALKKLLQIPETKKVDVPRKEDTVAEPFDEEKRSYDASQLVLNKAPYSDWPEEVDILPYPESMKDVDMEAYERLLRPKVVATSPTEDEHVITIEELRLQEVVEKIAQNLYTNYDGINFVYVQGKDKVGDLFITKTEISQKNYKKIMGTNPSYNAGDIFPVDSLSWYDVMVFCNVLSLREGRKPCYAIKGQTNPKKWGEVPAKQNVDWNNFTCDFSADGYRVLTNEEWTYAARGGLNKESGAYAGNPEIYAVAWFSENAGSWSHPVGDKIPNACGLYDMSGNLSEFVYDSSSGKFKAAQLRGGNFNSEEKACKVMAKESCDPSEKLATNGLRICRPVDQDWLRVKAKISQSESSE